MTPIVFSIDVLGSPAPKGNARAFVNKKTGRAILASFGSGNTEKRLRSWDALVREAASESRRMRGGEVTSAPIFVGVPLVAEVVFRLVRPRGHFSTAKTRHLLASAPLVPMGKPDADKLARSTLDCLHGTIFDDDSRIVDLISRKRYADADNPEGAWIRVREWRDPAKVAL